MARITTRKALALRKELEALVKAPALPLAVSLSAYVEANRNSPADAVAKGGEALDAAVARQARLSRVLRDLRVAVARANVEGEVESLLAGMADVERRIALERAVANAPLAPVEEELKGKVGQAWRSLQAEERYAARESVEVSVVTQDMRDAANRAIAELRREREALDDRRVAANASPRIEIADDDAAFLRELGLL